MFRPPPIIEAEVFARLPERFRRDSTGNRWVTENLRGRPTHSLLEGPSFDRLGNLYVVDVPFGRIFRIDPAGSFTLVCEYDGEPNGLKIHRDGRIFITDFRRGLMLLDPERGSVTTVLAAPAGDRFLGLNDLVFSSRGDLYFTDQGQSGLQDPSGRVFRLTREGRLQTVLGGIPSPNGIALTQDENALLLAVTRDNAIWRIPFGLDGSIAKVGVFIRLSGGVGPDGIALDAGGGLAVAHLGMGCAWIFDALGQPRVRINAPSGRSVTNVAYGTGQRGEIYFTEAETGTVCRACVDVPGRPLFSHSDMYEGTDR
jgi:gluconolactonase